MGVAEVVPGGGLAQLVVHLLVKPLRLRAVLNSLVVLPERGSVQPPQRVQCECLPSPVPTGLEQLRRDQVVVVRLLQSLLLRQYERHNSLTPRLRYLITSPYCEVEGGL